MIFLRKNNPRYSLRQEENYCLPESSYTAILKKLKEEGILIVRPEGMLIVSLIFSLGFRKFSLHTTEILLRTSY